MAVDTKLTDLATATSFDAASWFLLVDPTVTTMDASGTDLKIQAGDLIKGLLPSQAGNSGKVLSTNGTGTLSWIVGGGGGGSGTVTTVSVSSANGFGGTVANPTTTPAITITTSITGILKGNGTAISAAASGTDYEPPITAGTTAQYLKGDKSLGTLNQAAVAGLTTASSPTFAGLTVGTLAGLLKGTTGSVGIATAGTDYLTPSGSGASLTGITASQVGSVPAGILKGSGGAFVAATGGTDYLTTSYAGTSSIVTVGTITSGTWTGTTIAVANGGTGQTTAANAINALLPTQSGHNGEFLTTNGTVASWAASSGSGTVTTLSVVSANGLAGTVANPTTAPAITLSTTITGLLKGNGTAISAATAGTDYATLLTPTAVKTTAYSAAAGDFVPCDSTSAGFAVTLPTAPADKTLIGVKHVIQGGTNNVTVITGGSDVFNKAGGVTTLNLTTSSRGVVVQYKASSAIWYVISRDLGAVDAADVTTGQLAVAVGGTGQATASAAFNALSPNTTLGDVTYGSGTNTSTRLAGNTTATRKFLRQTGTGTVSAAPAWDTILAADVPAAGSTGQIQYNSSAALAGASNLTVGSSGQLTFGQISDPGSPAVGDVWVDSVQKVPSFVSGGLTARTGGIIWQGLSSGTAITNTTTATSVFAGVSTTLGSRVVPASALLAGKILRPILQFTTNVTGTPTIQWVVSLGGTAIFTYTTASLAAVTNGFSGMMPMTWLQFQSVGASGKVIGFVWLYTASGATVNGGTGGTGTNGSASWVAPTQVTIDTTAAVTFDVTAKWSVAAAGNSIQFVGGSLAIEG